jgi:tetratricopeptide (TPR) repeat protein
MKRILTQLIFILTLITFTNISEACLWDYDTLKMETREFPEALDLITGKFLRHSTAYYKWRIIERTAALKKEPKNLALYDDLAVAYDKVKQDHKAIEVILAKNSIKPDLYETHANLGTFYIHSGEFKKGLIHIKKAIEINPNAHFGREIYQMRLVEYVLSKQIDGKLTLPMNKINGYGRAGFALYVLSAAGIEKDYKKHNAELAKAEKGILGMMRFGNYDSPVLLEALGDILIGKGQAKRLACRAYLKASYESKDEAAKKAYRVKAKSTLSMQTKHKLTTAQLTLDQLEKTFTKELKKADKWYANILANEKKWKIDGSNMDKEFSSKYYRRTKQ